MDRHEAEAVGRFFRQDEEQGLPFIDMPSATDIAHHFIEEHCAKFDGQGCEGISLWREGGDYSYIWMEAHVDHDLDQFFLLDIRTNIDRHESRDYLFVWVGLGGQYECEWHNHPLPFGATFDKHLDRFISGMNWFLNSIVLKREGLAE